MKRQPGVILVVFTALLCGLAFSQNPPAPDPAMSRLDKLEKDLAAARLRIEALSTEVVDAKKQFAGAMHYLEEQGKSAAAMESVLDQAEKAGFTYGVNPDSRHILLRGWREQLAAAQKDVPVAPVAPPPPAPAPTKAPPAPTSAPTKAGTKR
jgi:hypothetical protein